MPSQAPSYHGYRFPSEIVSHAVWLYHRFALSFRDVEDLLAQRSITVTYETIRQGCLTFGPSYARTLRRRRGRLGDTWHLDELFVTLNGRRQYLWRAGLSLIKLTEPDPGIDDERLVVERNAPRWIRSSAPSRRTRGRRIATFRPPSTT